MPINLRDFVINKFFKKTVKVAGEKAEVKVSKPKKASVKGKAKK